MPTKRKRKSILIAMVEFTANHTKHEYKEGGHLEIAEYLTDNNNVKKLRILALDPTNQHNEALCSWIARGGTVFNIGYTYFSAWTNAHNRDPLVRRPTKKQHVWSTNETAVNRRLSRARASGNAKNLAAANAMLDVGGQG